MTQACIYRQACICENCAAPRASEETARELNELRAWKATAIERGYPWTVTATDKIKQLKDHLELAWGIIANAGGGDWFSESEEWRLAAAKWRDAYYYLIK